MKKCNNCGYPSLDNYAKTKQEIFGDDFPKSYNSNERGV